MPTLSKEDLALLKAPFAPDEHEFLKGMAYITEAAITDRIETVDPAWKLEQINLSTRPDAATGKPITVCTVRLTIKDTWRDGVGMADVNLTKQGNAEANEAEKSAATDAMKRAARLFGIGRYLLTLPENVRDPVSMKAYLQRGQKPVSSVGNPNSATTTPETPKSPFGKHPEANTTGLDVNRSFTVNHFQTNLTKKNTPYLIFDAGGEEYAYAFTRKLFEDQGYDVSIWKEVGNHEIVPPAFITCNRNESGKLEVVAVSMTDPFEEIGKPA